MFNLQKTPYALPPAAEDQVAARIREIEERVFALRHGGTLSAETIRQYYGDKRFEQVAESNALEGSTLDAGETELAVLKGVTITGHDPAFIKDAQALDKALNRLAEMAKERSQATNLEEIRELHGLILEGRGGLFRSAPVAIRSSAHRPPRTWQEVMNEMERWETWSIENREISAPIRAAVLHAWFAYVHPFLDGNGRTARAISNLELIRGGYPPIIIKKTQRTRYLDCLSESDAAGDIRLFVEFILERVEGALTGLELSAKLKQGYDPHQERIRIQQEQYLKIWESAVTLLAKTIESQLLQLLAPVNGVCKVRIYEGSLDLEDFVSLCQRVAAPQSWAFQVSIQLPTSATVEVLAYTGFRSPAMLAALNNEPGPAIYWAQKNSLQASSRSWAKMGEASSFANELTTKLGNGNAWHIRKSDDEIISFKTSRVARQIAEALFKLGQQKV